MQLYSEKNLEGKNNEKSKNKVKIIECNYWEESATEGPR